jgi:hypothetical protein
VLANPRKQLLALAGDGEQIVVGELALLFLDLALEFGPVVSDTFAVDIHD